MCSIGNIPLMHYDIIIHRHNIGHHATELQIFIFSCIFKHETQMRIKNIYFVSGLCAYRKYYYLRRFGKALTGCLPCVIFDDLNWSMFGYIFILFFKICLLRKFRQPKPLSPPSPFPNTWEFWHGRLFVQVTS
jgi:hypothetical protein